MKRSWLQELFCRTTTRGAIRTSAVVLAVAFRIVFPWGLEPAGAEEAATVNSLSLSRASGKSCPAIEPLTQIEIFRCPASVTEALFHGRSHGRVLHSRVSAKQPMRIDALIAREWRASKDDISACYRSSGVSSGELGYQLNAGDGSIVFLATAPLGDIVAAQACAMSSASDSVSTGVQRLGPRDVLLFPIELNRVRYVGAIAAIMLSQPDIMERKAAFMAQAIDQPVLALSTSIVSVDTVPCLNEIHRVATHP